MNQDNHTVIERYQLVPQENKSIKQALNQPTGVRTLVGLQLTGMHIDKVYARGIVSKLKVEGTNVLPDDLPAKMLLSAPNVPPNNRFFMFPQPVGLGARDIEIEYADTEGSGAVAFAAYAVDVILMFSKQ